MDAWAWRPFSTHHAVFRCRRQKISILKCRINIKISKNWIWINSGTI
jgi:hypothetical protein